MNDHIRRLAGKALDRAVPQTWTTLTADDLNKFTEVFADLLVRECALQCIHNEDMDRIEKHFGVES